MIINGDKFMSIWSEEKRAHGYTASLKEAIESILTLILIVEFFAFAALIAGVLEIEDVTPSRAVAAFTFLNVAFSCSSCKDF